MELCFKKVVDFKMVMIEMIMLNDINFMGNLMGGNFLWWMDIVCGICVGKYIEVYVVMVLVDYVFFEKFIWVGDIVMIEVSVIRVFRIFIEVYVEVFVVNIKGFNFWRCNYVYFIFVVLNEENGMFVFVFVILLFIEIE